MDVVPKSLICAVRGPDFITAEQISGTDGSDGDNTRDSMHIYKVTKQKGRSM